MFWVLLGALYLLGAPITMFFLTVGGFCDSSDIDRADAIDIVVFIAFWPILCLIGLIAAAAILGERVNARKGRK